MDNLKLILIVLITFSLAFVTTLLLELPIFKHWLRQSIVVMLVLVELYFGFITYKDFITENNKQ